ncbi:GAF domain-containing protein [Leptolyngbya sp. FACHB-671]|nr:GAF domain-containing protein [Leptolyngbya sp. FACHB-671]
MVENLPGGAAFVVDSDLRYRLAEGEALSAAGFKPEDLVGHTIFEVLPPDLAASYEGLYRKGLAGETFKHEHNAHDRFYISWGTPLRSANGEVYAVLAVSYDITDRKRVEAERKQAEAAAAADLEDTQRLRELSTRLVAEDDIQTLYQEIVATAIALTRADAGSVQILDEATQDCLLLAAQGFEQTIIERFYRVNASSNASCGMTLATGDCAFIDFDGPHKDLDASVRWHFEAGYLSAQSTPLISRSGKVIGMVSTHWRKHHRPSDRELRFLDLLARQAADLIEQRQAQVTLRESEEKYRLLFNAINEGYFLIDVIFDETNQPVDLLYLESNQAAIAMTGQDFTGRRLSEINPNYELFWYEIFGRVARTGKGERLERYAKPDQKWYDFYVVKVGNASARRIAVVFQDITERKQAEEKLHRAAEMDAFRVKLSDALRSLTNPVEIQAVAARVLGEHLGANQVHYGETIGEYVVISQGYGNGLPPMVGRFRFIDFGERLIADYRAGRISLSRDVVNDPNITESKRQVITGAGFRAYVAVPLTKAEGWVATLAVHSIASHGWTTDEVELVQETAEYTWAAVERARAEKALRESEIQRIQEQSAREQERQRAEALTELDRAKTIFFSNVSHEFRTPLTLMLAPLQDALSDRALPPAHREGLDLAHRSSLRLLKLVNTLLNFSRIEAGRMEAVYEPVDLAQCTTELASVFRSAIERAGLRLIVDCPPLPEPVFVDREMWEKIVLNLLSNAFKFTFEGEITLSIRAEAGETLQASTAKVDSFTSKLQMPGSKLETLSLELETPSLEPEIPSLEPETSNLELETPSLELGVLRSEVKSSPSFPRVVLEVRDTGVGILLDDLPHLFERFYQVRGTQARTHEGSGIGLALVNELVRLHGGTINVSSTVGQGTCFTIALFFGTEHLPSDRLQVEGDRIQPTRTLASTAIDAALCVKAAEQWAPLGSTETQRYGDAENSTVSPTPRLPLPAFSWWMTTLICEST